MKTLTDNTPRAWVGCLGCYNSGRLVGKWIDGREAGDLVAAGLATVETVGDYTAPRCVRCFGDEFWTMDLEGYGGFLSGECSPITAQEIALLIEELERQGIDLDAAGAFIEDRGAWDLDAFQDSYVGQYESLEEYAQELAGELYGKELDDARWPFTCINWQHAAEELSHDYALLGGGYVFRQC
jgi:antirestriction protein